MININGKEYKINLDIKWGTEKLMRKVLNSPESPENDKYMNAVFKDILIPSPTAKEMFNFRMSDITSIFEAFGEESDDIDKDFKKKLGQ